MRNLIEEPVRAIFLGTGWESVESLKVLYEDPKFEVVCVITTPDKPVGRKQVMTPSEVKVYAKEKGINVVHTERKEENYNKVLEKYKPELVVCKAFGEIVPKSFIEYPKYKCINIHFSILPKYRGAVPIQKAILDGVKETGISIMEMSEGLDEGDILEIYREEIEDGDTNLSLRKRLVKKSSEILSEVLEKWINGEIEPKKQENEGATYCWQKDISKENAEILWNKYDPEYIERMVRAFLPWPIAWCKLGGDLENKNIANKSMKIFRAVMIETPSEKDPGFLFQQDCMLLFSTIDPHVCIRVLELQIEGRNKTNEKEFLNGIGKQLPS
ncbi:MAG: methionyl-tRNA formyltransferase [Candidatus Dojkabacteria bacterium]